MTHDYCHCDDYDPDICPDDCFRAQLAVDLMQRKDLYGRPLTFSSLKNTKLCPLKVKEIRKESRNGK